MAIDTLSQFHPKLALPVYTKIIGPRFNDYRVGETYEMRLNDQGRAKERGQKGPYNYIHECLLIAKEEVDVDEVPDILLAFDKNTQYRDEALEVIYDNDGEVVLLVFLRIDKAKAMVTEGLESVHKKMSKEATEDKNMEGEL